MKCVPAFLAAVAIVTGGPMNAAAVLLAADPAMTAPNDSLPAREPNPGNDLAASTAAPWVPERPIPAAVGWETALRLPGRLVSLPLSGLGILTKHTFMGIEETNFITRTMVTLAVLPQAGVVIGPAALGDETGLGVAIGFSPPGLRRHLTARWDGSTLKYSRTRVEARYGQARLDYAYEWRPRDHFYGLGPSSSGDDVSSYATQSQSVRLGLSRRIVRGAGPEAPRWDLAGWFGPREVVTRHGRGDDDPSFEERFPSLRPFLDHRFEQLMYGVRVALDHRRGKPHWGTGGRALVEVERFDRPLKALALRTSRTAFQFTRWTCEAEGGISFYRDPRTVRLALRLVDNVPDFAGLLPLSDLTTLGGSHGLGGFLPGRFQDVDAVVGRISYVFPLALRLEFDVHAEVGQVCGDVWSDARLASLAQSYGVTLRPRLDNAILGMIGLDWSAESVRLRFSIGGVG